MTITFSGIVLVASGFVFLVAAAYIIVRVCSIAHFRTRTEYDRGEWNSWKNGEDTNG
jgi:hypothetical protein